MPAPLYSLGGFRAALATARLFPRAFCRQLAPLIASQIGRRMPAGVNALRENLRPVTDLTGPDLDRLCRINVRNFSRSLSDYFYCACRPPAAAGNLLERWEGLEHLKQARAAGKGIILLTGHLGHWELGGVLLSQQGIPMTVVTLEEPSGALTHWREEYRKRAGISTITVGPGREFAFVEMMRVLRENGCIAMLVDRPYAGNGSPVSFFGRPTEFSSAPALLWQHTGAAVIPAFVTECPSGRYQAEARAPLPFTTEGGTRAALLANTQTVASAFESVIRHYPDQWYNYVPIWHPPSP